MLHRRFQPRRQHRRRRRLRRRRPAVQRRRRHADQAIHAGGSHRASRGGASNDLNSREQTCSRSTASRTIEDLRDQVWSRLREWKSMHEAQPTSLRSLLGHAALALHCAGAVRPRRGSAPEKLPAGLKVVVDRSAAGGDRAEAQVRLPPAADHRQARNGRDGRPDADGQGCRSKARAVTRLGRRPGAGEGRRQRASSRIRSTASRSKFR